MVLYTHVHKGRVNKQTFVEHEMSQLLKLNDSSNFILSTNCYGNSVPYVSLNGDICRHVKFILKVRQSPERIFYWFEIVWNPECLLTSVVKE